MTQLDLNAPIAAEIGRLTVRAVTAETLLAYARDRIAELEAEAEKKEGE